jgi:hypothetical protein
MPLLLLPFGDEGMPLLLLQICILREMSVDGFSAPALSINAYALKSYHLILCNQSLYILLVTIYVSFSLLQCSYFYWQEETIKY